LECPPAPTKLSRRQFPNLDEKENDEIEKTLISILNQELQQSSGGESFVIPSNFKRMTKGMYLFGTKKIHMALLSGRLVVRVGGGYMTFLEFVKKNGRMECLKLEREGFTSGESDDEHSLVKLKSPLIPPPSQRSLREQNKEKEGQ